MARIRIPVGRQTQASVKSAALSSLMGGLGKFPKLKAPAIRKISLKKFGR